MYLVDHLAGDVVGDFDLSVACFDCDDVFALPCMFVYPGGVFYCDESADCHAVFSFMNCAALE